MAEEAMLPRLVA